MTDFFKDSPAYHWITDDARTEGLERGREEGRMEGLRESILNIVSGRFPSIVLLTEKQLPLIQHIRPLERLVRKAIMAQTAAEVRQYLVEAVDESVQRE